MFLGPLTRGVRGSTLGLMEPTGRATPRRQVLAAAIPVAGAAVSLVAAAQEPDVREHWWWALPVLLLIVSAGVVGFLVVRRHPGHPVGWLLLAHGVGVGFGLSTPPTDPDTTTELAFAQVTAGSWIFLYVCLVLIGYLFPDGRFPSGRWRAWVGFCLAGYVALFVGDAWNAEVFRTEYGREPPLPTPPAGLATVVDYTGFAVVIASLLGTVVCCHARLRRATGDERLQLLWFTWAALSIPAMLAVCALDIVLTGEPGTPTVVGIAVLGTVVPVVIGIAMLRHRLFDIEPVLSRTLVYGALTVAVVGTYALVVTVADRLFASRAVAGLLAVGLVAVAVQPVHGVLRRRVERWVYGDRSDPAAALRRLSDRVEETADPAKVVNTVTESVAEALRADRAWVELDSDTASPVNDQIVRVPLTHRRKRLGVLVVDVGRGRQLTAADRSLLADLARHAAVVVASVHLTLDLQRSRARLVTAREEERRRLRRDLHDGVGPSLAAIVLKLNAAQSRRDAGERNRLLTEVREETRAAIAEVRRLVDDLRPPAIDEVGLVGAIRQRVASLAVPGLAIEVAGPAVLPTLPAAVEVAAFRIATEAVTNVVRHARATRCVVRLGVNGAFELTVTDNGRGAPDGTVPGVGWTSMTERAAELGGACTISRRTEGGTVLRAVIPLPAGSTSAVAL